MKASPTYLFLPCAMLAWLSFYAPAEAAPHSYTVAQVYAPSAPTRRNGWVPMSQEMRKKVEEGWKKQADDKLMRQDPEAYKQMKAKEKSQHADNSLTEQAIDAAAAKAVGAASSQAIKYVFAPDGSIVGVEGPDGTVITPSQQQEEEPYTDPTNKVMPVQVAPRVYKPQEEEYKPNTVNQGGIGAVGGLGRVGNPTTSR